MNVCLVRFGIVAGSRSFGAAPAQANRLRREDVRRIYNAMQRRSLLPIVVPMLIGAAFLGGAAASLGYTITFLRHAVATQASFVGSIAHAGGNHGGTFYYPRFSFRTRDGRVVSITSRSGSSDQPYAAGEQRRVFYDPDRPERALLGSFWTLWAAAVFLAIPGIMFTGLPLLVVMGLRARNARGRQRGGLG